MAKNPHIADQLPPKEKTVTEHVADLFDQYLDTTGAILEDYIPDPGMMVELACADKNFKEEIAALGEELESNEPEFKQLLEKLKALGPGEIDVYDLLRLCDTVEAYSHPFETYAAEKGYALIKIETLQQRTKLEAFVTTEIWPNYNEKDNYNI